MGALYVLLRVLGLPEGMALLGAIAGVSAHELNPTYAKKRLGIDFLGGFWSRLL